jgi:hypothetical protein
MTYPNADGVEIGPKLVVEARSHLYFIEFLERANRAAATESDDQVVELSNPREKILHSRHRVRLPHARVARSPMAAAAPIALSGVRPVTQTCAPARYNSVAAANPMPEVPPTTTAFCSRSIPVSMVRNHPIRHAPRQHQNPVPCPLTNRCAPGSWAKENSPRGRRNAPTGFSRPAQ